MGSSVHLLSCKSKEPYNDVITMHNFRPDTVKRLVQFMYTGDYDDPDDACLGAGKVEIGMVLTVYLMVVT